jgi:hypothetical protein
VREKKGVYVNAVLIRCRRSVMYASLSLFRMSGLIQEGRWRKEKEEKERNKEKSGKRVTWSIPIKQILSVN